MNIREAVSADIPQMQVIRNSVKENILSDPSLVTEKDYEEFMNNRGKGWVCEIDEKIVGFAIADLREQNIWALFIDPAFEKHGIGRRLHDTMLDWYFSQEQHIVWLGTTPKTRAEAFYRKAGWQEKGTHGKDEIRFEMTHERWKRMKTGDHNS
ncbi:GNAT family N-acetyltransferase [Aridibaculum aurantiacum]|uniref:GNAT family N-acetyltransferase n=1 Tax=Aridibaculum aurantiacum TaxID=2810307 RepID=UPI001A966B99|nr:GNAT family N-acetyltransferase [Aridibaculum aurantiacum]